MNFELVTQAGLTQGEFAGLCGVDRVTINLWMNGHRQPHRLLDDRVRGVLSVLAYAIDNGFLPVMNIPPGDSARADAVATGYYNAATEMQSLAKSTT